MALLSIGYTFAQNKVVVVPLGGEKAGIQGYEIVGSSIQATFSGQDEESVTAFCPSGKKAIGGGGDEFSTVILSDSRPSQSGFGWTIAYEKGVFSPDTDFSALITAFAVCAEVDEA
ncbi:MAG: hypothetical protein AAF478_13720 [Pseudomonadota bacterium]